jgi:N-acetylneuraminic acid mutarotase
MQRGAGGAGIVGRELHYFGGRDFDRDTDEVDHWMLDLDHPENGWVSRAPLPAPRNHLGTAVLNGKIYAVGGQYLEEDSGINSDAVDVYDPLTDAWTSAANLPLPISHTHASTVVMNGKIVSLGGEYEHNQIASEVLVYDPTVDMWSLLGYLPAPRRAMVAGAAGNQLIATGGFNGTTQQTTTWVCTPVV